MNLKANVQKVSTCLWFDRNAEEATELYVSLFDNSHITGVTRYGRNGHMPEGTVLTILFELDGTEFTALNGGPRFKFTEASSMVVKCGSKAESDRLWSRLQDGGGSEQQCGWLKDRFGLSWQIVPDGLITMLQDPNEERVNRMFSALLGMIKLDVKQVEAAYHGH